MTDIVMWVSFVLQVWTACGSPFLGQRRRRRWRASVTRWNLGFFKRSTLEIERSDTRF
jgi:hypothetical protein